MRFGLQERPQRGDSKKIKIINSPMLEKQNLYYILIEYRG